MARASAELLAERGAAIAIVDRPQSSGAEVAAALDGTFHPCDVTDADQVELATLAWVGWWNQRRLHGALDHIPPAEHEANYYREFEQSKEVV